MFRIKLFLLVLSTILVLSNEAASQTETDIDILRMYFWEKDLLVITPTRVPKLLSQTAENISVVTAEEIALMNAHTVADVLDRVTGIFVSSSRDFGAPSLMLIQGSEERHVQVMLDGVPWNFLADGSAETNSIPVGIVDRIEIIKGPASSAWGSALGGVINIITKATGEKEKPSGSFRVSYGERSTRDYRAQVSGKTGILGYYLFAGQQDSGRLHNNRYFDTNSIFGKFKASFTDSVNLQVSFGYSRPHMGLGAIESVDLESTFNNNIFYFNSLFDARLTEDFRFQLSFYTVRQKAAQDNRSLGQGITGPEGSRYLKSVFDEKTTGATSKLMWQKGIHTAVLGADYKHGKLEQILYSGEKLQASGACVRSKTSPDVDEWAVYANDTINMGRWSITPGVRYDHNSISGSFVSPSLGITCSLGKRSLLKAFVARGFTSPALSFLTGGALFTEPNRSLDPEQVWSYQIGINTTIFPFLDFKMILFRHDLKRSLDKERIFIGPTKVSARFVNKGNIRRTGVDMEIKTKPFHNLSFSVGYVYVHLSPEPVVGYSDIYTYKIGITYNDHKTITAQLYGSYTWWDLDAFANGSYDDFIWEFNLAKKIYEYKSSIAEMFFTAHNLFSGSQYEADSIKNQKRWMEAGIKLSF